MGTLLKRPLRGRILMECPQQKLTLWRLPVDWMKLTASKIDPTWTRVMTSTHDEWRRLERRCGPFQEELTGFVLGFTHKLSGEAQGLARDCMVACFEIYREHFPVIRKASDDQILAQWRRCRPRIADAEALTDAGAPLQQMYGGSPQPLLFEAVVDTLLGPDPDDLDAIDESALDDEEFWEVLAVLDTVIAVLDECAQTAPAP